MVIHMLLSEAVKDERLKSALLRLNTGEEGKFLSWVKTPQDYSPIHVFLAEDLDAVAMVKNYEGSHELLFGVFVEPAQRRKGKGQALWQEAVKTIKGSFCVMPPDEDAIQFFRRVGL